jgi:micrococcal nuclease
MAIIALLALGLKLFPSLATPPATTPTPEQEQYKVTKVIDGDTIKISRGDHEETLRLLGIDTPETDPTYNPIECYGKEATKETSTLLGTMVQIETDPKQATYDKYHRLLVYVYSNGVNFNEHLVKAGFAREYTYAGAYKYQSQFKTAEDAAKKANLGLWSKENCPQ